MCDSFVDNSGYGNCKKASKDNKVGCYVVQPTTCKDAFTAGAEGRKYSRSQACGISGNHILN